MGGPVGNKHALGNCGGRPITNRIEKANDLIKWVEDPENWTIKAWRIKHKITRDQVIEMCDTSVEFSNAYQYAFDVIAQRREEMNHKDKMKDSLYSQHLKVYDRDRAEYDESVKDKQLIRELKKIEKEIELKMAQGKATDEEIEYLNKSFGIVDQLQDLLSKRKIADSSSSADAKS